MVRWFLFLLGSIHLPFLCKKIGSGQYEHRERRDETEEGTEEEREGVEFFSLKFALEVERPNKLQAQTRKKGRFEALSSLLSSSKFCSFPSDQSLISSDPFKGGKESPIGRGLAPGRSTKRKGNVSRPKSDRKKPKKKAGENDLFFLLRLLLLLPPAALRCQQPRAGWP